MTKFTQKTESIFLSLTESLWGFCVVPVSNSSVFLLY